MQKPTRLFDCLEYQLKELPLPDMFAAKEGGRWKKYSTAEVNDTVNQLASGLLHLGISPNDMSAENRDKVAIISKNRPEWLMIDLAAQKIGAVLAPVYPTINVNELQFILNDSQAKVIFVNDEELFLKVKSIKDYVPSLQHIFTLEHVTNATYWKDCLQAGNCRNTNNNRTIICRRSLHLILPLLFIHPAQQARQKELC